MSEDIAVTRFRDFLRLDTVHPDPDYGKAVHWLQDYGKELGLAVTTFEAVPGKPFVTLTLPGSQPQLPCVALYCHYDVVPVYEQHWKHPPFSAHKDEKGDIYARGSQDMKCVGIQYCEALRRLRKANPGFQCERTIMIMFAPEEEIGGFDGMKALAKSDQYPQLNIGFMMDEGLACPDDHYMLYNAERVIWWMKVTCTGNPGHGSKFIENTAAEKVGGIQTNIVPSEISLWFDIRMPPETDFEAFEKHLVGWLNESGPGISHEFEQYYRINCRTPVDDSNPWFVAFKGALDKAGATFKVETFVGATDSGRFVRPLGVPCLNFSPMRRTPVLLHDHNEFLNETVFLDGVRVYELLIPALGDVSV